MVTAAFGDFTKELKTGTPNYSLENYSDHNNEH